MKMITMPILPFEEMILSEIKENPALETEILGNTHNKIKRDNSQNETFYSLNKLEVTLQERLKSQLIYLNISKKEKIILNFLIDSLDSNGYLRDSLEDLVSDIHFILEIDINVETLKQIVKNYLQKLSPKGIGASNLQECLLLQLQKKHKKNFNAIQVLEKGFELLVSKQYRVLAEKLNLSSYELISAIELIKKTNPKPGLAFSNTFINRDYIIPDFIIQVEGQSIKLILNKNTISELHVSKSYSELAGLNLKAGDQKSTKVLHAKQMVEKAVAFITMINQRYQTLQKVAETIINFQKPYFITGDKTKLKPMLLKDISFVVGVSDSAISKVINSKYISTPYGVYLLKNFFSKSVCKRNGKEVSANEIKAVIEELIDTEDIHKPYSDINLSRILQERGYTISNRKVTKYRKALGYDKAMLRKSSNYNF